MSLDLGVVPGAPAMPGLSFRRFRGEADYPAMVDILDACNVADGLEYINSIEEIAQVFAHLTNCNPVQDMLFAEVDGVTVAFSRVWWVEEMTPGAGAAQRLYVSLGFVHPEWRRRGLGAAMLNYDESRLRDLARGHPAEKRKVFRVWATNQEHGAQALFARAGYEPVRHLVEMVRPIGAPLPPAPMPAGLEVRPVHPAQIRAVWEAMWEARQDHWGYVPPTENDYERWTSGRLFAPHLWQVAWALPPAGSAESPDGRAEGGEIAGMVLNRVDEEQNDKYGRRRGWTQDIFVRRPWRRRGLARSLLVRSIQIFREMGMEETALGVDTQNPSGALQLYENVGYRPVRTFTYYSKRMNSETESIHDEPARDEEKNNG
jgi:mycothiol synthase